MFSQVSVCPQGCVSASMHVGITPPLADTPLGSVSPLGRYPRADTSERVHQPIIWQNFCGKLHEKERNLIEGARP